MTLTLPDKAVIACIHLLPTPGSPRYGGSVRAIYEQALHEAEMLARHGVDALIVENFRDGPFHPAATPPETIATVAAVTREVVRATALPVGVAVLRNDALGALSAAVAAEAVFIRVNVHVGAVLAAQGVVTGSAHETMRLRRTLGADVAILADAGVKHSYPFAYPNLSAEIRDAAPFADGIVVSGELTGTVTAHHDLREAKESTDRPVFVGSGVDVANLPVLWDAADGFIVGSALKEGRVPANRIEESRVAELMNRVRELRGSVRR